LQAAIVAQNIEELEEAVDISRDSGILRVTPTSGTPSVSSDSFTPRNELGRAAGDSSAPSNEQRRVARDCKLPL